ncbi:MAG: M20/M25/M40 family metallo-hydrolase [Pseudomonadota bacterium]
MSDITPVLSAIDRGLDHSLSRLFELLRIPSVSTDPAYTDDCVRAADWLVAELSGLGFTASRRDTSGKPMVVAHGGPAKETTTGPHVLFYGHYDVQPADPLDLWESGPFDPQLNDGSDGKIIVCRGASDDKGQLMTFVEAVRAIRAVHGDMPVPVTILFEGEEESGSPSLGPFLDAHQDELRADVAMVCDTGMWTPDTPAITTRLRGLAHDEVTIEAASRDLHSGMYGGSAQNPIRILSKVIAALHDETERIAIPGFYDDVVPLEAEVDAQWREMGFDETAFLDEIGLKTPFGEAGRPGLERIWARPTAEVNGMIGGYTGIGSKTVIPSQASAKFTFRLVADQDPAKVIEAFRTMVRDLIPEDCTASFSEDGGGSPALSLPLDSPYLAPARQAIADEWGTEAVLVGSGGSIPIVGDFKRKLGMDSLLIGFALDDDRIHSPNEKYNLKSFHSGIRTWARLLMSLRAS